MSEASGAPNNDTNARAPFGSGTQFLYASIVELRTAIDTVFTEHFGEFSSSTHGFMKNRLDG